MKINFQNPLSRFLAAFLGLLGFVTACTSADLYGSPYATFKITGTVTDQEQNPIPNAQITIRDDYRYAVANGISESDGSYLIEESDYWGGKKIYVVTTCDGYEKDSTMMELEFKGKKKKDDFYMGSCSCTYNPVLQKEQASENADNQASENNN
ncbi:MAG: radical SAM-associated putative lipoprotein [Bacteroidales bacterium]|nr:radical SAM-associated putative lipoprotein [Bacteroidales bacterium]MCQ2253667.1 radical SAM-associated putative lipoprotein [Bacteroidales bacterium]